MMRALNTSTSGLSSLQFQMDVIGDNIANTNTVGFKTSRAAFSDQFYQLEQGATSRRPVDVTVGFGSKTVGTDTLYRQGAFQRTDIPSDVAIQGRGFFTLVDTTDGTTPTTFTRAGGFIKDADGYMRTLDGKYLAGIGNFGTTAPATDFTSTATTYDSVAAVRIPANFSTTQQVAGFSIGNDGAIAVTSTDGNSRIIGYLGLATFISETGLRHQDGTNFTATTASGEPTLTRTGENGAGTFQSGVLEQSNADLSEEFTRMIITQRGFDANARGISTASEMLRTAIGLKRS